MKYAIFYSNGKQYKAVEGETILLERINAKPESIINFNEVLLYVEDEKIQVGTPYVPKILVQAKLLNEVKGDKIRVSKFKSKVRYRKVLGFRSLLSKIKIEKIQKVGEVNKSLDSKKPQKTTKTKKE